MPSSPGTVSKILWHFTGGPNWNRRLNAQEALPKPIDSAYNSLISILKSKEIRLGQYREVVNVIVPVVFERDPETHNLARKENVFKALKSSPVCCLADIPIMHLEYHASRYGKIAIGIHRDSAIAHGFNPVFYQLQDSHVLRAIYEGMANLDTDTIDDLDNEVSNIESELTGIECEEGHTVEISTSFASDLQTLIGQIHSNVKEAESSFDQFLAFVKTFKTDEFSTIYCEREWRAIKTFNFQFSDISMIVLPRNPGSGDHFERFVNEAALLSLPPTVSIVAWDDLIEH